MSKLINQADKFNLDKSITYLNGAFMSPQLKAVSEAGFEAIRLKENPSQIGVDDFFESSLQLRAEFSRLINNNNVDRVALIPSVSYGMANVTRNLNVKGRKVLIVSEQFPSNVYPWMRLTTDQGGRLEIVEPPTTTTNRGENWNKKVIAAIDMETAVVAISHVHWADGTIFDLIALRERTREVNALLVIDGTQSVGALPFNVQEIQPDALICAGYKWLLGPYGLGLAYYGEAFNDGIPIEENWINRLQSEDFSGLVEYENEYQSGAQRYSMGEQSQFILSPMLLTALKQINTWRADRIQRYCDELVNESINELRNHGYWIEEASYRANHLFGIRHETLAIDAIKSALVSESIFVSFRGTSIRVSPYVHNTLDDIEKLVTILTDLT